MKRCNRCGCVAFDDEDRCNACGSSSFMGVRDDELTLRDGIRYVAAMDRNAPYDERRCQTYLSDIVPNLEEEQNMLDTAFRAGAIERLRYATQDDQDYHIAVEQMHRNGMNDTAVTTVLEGYGFTYTPAAESTPPAPPHNYPPNPNPYRGETIIAPPVPPAPEPPVTPENTGNYGNYGNNGNKRILVGLLAEAVLVAAIVVALLFITKPTTTKSTPADASSGSTETQVSATESSSDDTSDSENDQTTTTGSTHTSKQAKNNQNKSQTSEPASGATTTPEPQNEEPAQPTEDTTEPASEHRYEVTRADISWTDANAACNEKGGHLATITSQEEFDTIVSLAEQYGLEFVWLGGRTASGSTTNDGEWITGETFEFSRWYPGEPSHQDVDGTPEQYIELWHVKSTDEWSMNDERDRPFDDPKIAQYMSGNLGYVCEYEA